MVFPVCVAVVDTRHASRATWWLWSQKSWRYATQPSVVATAKLNCLALIVQLPRASRKHEEFIVLGCDGVFEVMTPQVSVAKLLRACSCHSLD